MKKFDLNIEKILENWETHHAIREIIANAMDEQILTKSDEVIIKKKDDSWIIRDFGRGLQYFHLTQNENPEKLSNENVIGRFGIGLKDALATFDRRNIKVFANSKYGKISILKSPKQGFDDINTLHAIIDNPINSNFVGTEFELIGITENDMDNAKKLFLKFSGEVVMESTRQGQIIRKNGKCGNIYINGVKVSEEDNFLFSYNITSKNSQIKKALNRERSNVGRSAYTESIKKILLASKEKEVAEALAKDLMNINKGTSHDELAWIDVQEHSVKILNQSGKYVFIASYEAMEYPSMIDEARRSGYEVIIIPDNLQFKIKGSKDLLGNPIIDMGQFIENYNDSFEFDFIDPENLSIKELQVYQFTSKIVSIFGKLPNKVKDIKISSKMRKDFFSESVTLGCWDSSSKFIVLSRKTLKSLSEYSGTLIHELIHAKTGYNDVSVDFENALTEKIGEICEIIINE